MTNNIANVRNLDAKHNLKYRISPAWIYNLIKGKAHSNEGANKSEFFVLALKQGAPYWSDFPGETTPINYKSWNPDPVVWEKALANRIDHVEKCCVYNADNNKLDLLKVKKILYNGYVVSFSSDFDENLIYRGRIKYPEEHKNEYMLVVNKKTANTGGHAMTIVGWDDTLKIDIDGNGTVDSKGAFKVANSWGINGIGTDGGYFWLAYDAILMESLVPGMNEGSRDTAIRSQTVYFLEPKISYQPILLLELILKTDSRKQLGIRLGASDVNEAKPKEYKFIFDKSNEEDIGICEGEAIFWFKNYLETNTHYDFYGNETNQKEATFVFDLTDTVVDYYGTQGEFFNSKDTNFYIQVEDKIKDGYGSILKGVKIIDRINNRQADFSDLNVQVDGTKKEVKLKATVVPGIVDENKMFVLNFNYPIQKTSISNIKVKKNSQSVSGIAFENDTDRKKVTVFPPDKGYLRGQYYSMDLSGVKSDGGNLLHKNAIDFYVP